MIMGREVALEARSASRLRLVSVSEGVELRFKDTGVCRKCDECLGSKCGVGRELDLTVGTRSPAEAA